MPSRNGRRLDCKGIPLGELPVGAASRLSSSAEVKSVELASGSIEYRDSGTGPVIVFLHGLLMDGSLWDDVIADLSGRYRCIAPTLPLGSHQTAMDVGTDLSLRGLAAMVDEFVHLLNVTNAILVGSDTGGAIVQVILARGAEWVDRAVLVSCDAFENFPPGLTGKALFAAGRLPPVLFGWFMQQMRLRLIRRLPIAFGWLTKSGDDATVRWLEPILTRPEIRRATVELLRTLSADRSILVDEAERMFMFNRPVLVAWATEDRIMPPEHGRRLAELFPQGQLVEIADSYTLISLDQAFRLSRAIEAFAS